MKAVTKKIPLFSKEGLGEIWQKKIQAHTKGGEWYQISPSPSLSKEGSGSRKFYFCAFLSLFLTACATKQPQFSLPNQVNFNNKTFVKTTDNRLDELRQLLYLPQDSDQNPEDWQQGILFFLDQNTANQSLEQRAELRRKAYATTQPQTLAKVAVEQGELRTEVIYPPTERFNNVQLEVSRGRNLACGFGQIQYANKGAVGAKNLPISLKNYQQQTAALALKLAALSWQIECK